MKMLRHSWVAPVALGLALSAGWNAPRSAADEGGKSVTVDLKSPTQIPGRVLRPGSYVLETSGGQSGWNVIRVYSGDKSALVATLLAYPNPQIPSEGKKVLVYPRGGANGAVVMEGWFFDGDSQAEQWAYPKVEADRIGRANHLRIPTTGTADVYPSALPLAANSWSAPVDNAATSAANDDSAASMKKATTESAESRELPKTASYRPLAGLLGFLALCAAFFLHKFAGSANTVGDHRRRRTVSL
jgi:hypothetical protein